MDKYKWVMTRCILDYPLDFHLQVTWKSLPTLQFYFFFLLALVSLTSTQTPEGSLYQIPASTLSEQVDWSNCFLDIFWFL